MAASETTLALGIALGLALPTTPAPVDSTPDPYRGPAIGAEALYDGTWTEPGTGWRGALTATGPIVPAGPKAAQDDKPDYYSVERCHVSKTTTTVDPCALGNPEGEAVWLVLGSSKVGTWVEPLSTVAEREGIRLEVGTRSTTPWTPNYGSGDGRTYNDAALEHVRETKPEVLFLTLDQPATFEMGPDDYHDVITQALDAGAGHVAVLWNPDEGTPNPMTCLENQPADYRDCAFQFVGDDLDREIADRASAAGDISYVSVEDWVAPDGAGHMVIGGVITRGAGSHLTATYAKSLEVPLQSELFEAGLVDSDPDGAARVSGAHRD